MSSPTTTHDVPAAHPPHRRPDSAGGRTPLLLRADHTVSLAWRALSYEVAGQAAGETKTLLHRTSGCARGGRVLAIMGPSGAGKTTLMHALSGRLHAASSGGDGALPRLRGACEMNGVRMTARHKKLVSVVCQDDIVMGKETPRDALHFSARMRLGLSDEAASERTAQTLSLLQLDGCADTVVGVPGVIKGLSGGEKKRVNIGAELIADPCVVILDEPTTGLDSVNAVRVGQLMQDLAHDGGRTVICTVHTPSSALFDLFDDLLLLAQGHVVYHGAVTAAPAYFASVGYPVPPRTNPSEFYMNLLEAPQEGEEGKGSEGRLPKLFEAWAAHCADGGVAHPPNGCISAFPQMGFGEAERLALKVEARSHTSLALQFQLLLGRAARMMRRDPQATGGRLAQTIYIGLLIGLFFFGLNRTDRGAANIAGALLMVVINQVFGAALPGITMFPPERAVFLTEQASESYNPVAYVAAKIAVEMPFNMLFPVVYAGITYFMFGLRDDSAEYFFIFLLLVAMASTAAFSFGLVISSVFARLEVAMAFGPLLLLPMMLVSGFFANTERLDPGFLWLNYISFPRFAFSGLIVNEFRGRTLCDASSNSTSSSNNTTASSSFSSDCRYVTGDDYLEVAGFADWPWTRSVWLLAVITAVFWALAALSLSLQGRAQRGSGSGSSEEGLTSDDYGESNEKVHSQ